MLQVKLGDNLNTVVAVKTGGKRKFPGSHKFGEEKIHNFQILYSRKY